MRLHPFSMLLGIFFFGLGFLLGGSACFYSGIINGPTCNPKCWNWPIATGTVVTSGVHKTPGLGSAGQYVWVQYTYSVAGKTYSQIGPEGSDSSSLNWHSETKTDGNYLVASLPDKKEADSLSPLQVGKAIRVHYNPQKPDESIWDSGLAPMRTFMTMVFAIALLIAGFTYGLYGFGLLKQPMLRE